MQMFVLTDAQNLTAAFLIVNTTVWYAALQC